MHQKSLLIAVKGGKLTSLEGCRSSSHSVYIVYLGRFKQDRYSHAAGCSCFLSDNESSRGPWPLGQWLLLQW